MLATSYSSPSSNSYYFTNNKVKTENSHNEYLIYKFSKRNIKIGNYETRDAPS